MAARHVIPMILLATTVLPAVAETRVRIEGMSHMSESQAMELLGGRLIHVRSSAATASLADDAAFLLRQVLHKDGFADATVDWKVSSPREIVLLVREGARRALGKVTLRCMPQEDVGKLVKLYAKPPEQ